MTTAGFDSQRLASVSELVDRYVAEGKLAGAQVQIAHRGEVALRHTVGRADVASNRPLGDDAIYRIYSMTKPITSIALMQLYEQGRVLLEDPVSAYIPEFAEMQVFTGGTPTAPKVRPAQTVMTVKDVLTHASGLTYGFFFQNNLDAMYREDGLGNFELPDYTLEEGMRLLAAKPLAFDPGTAWNYSMSTDVCGRLVEVISGMGLDEYFAEHITGPLGMADTAFHVPADKVHRFTSNYQLTPEDPLATFDSFDASPYLSPPVFLSGGGGLVGTVDDYQRFVDMLLNGGELDGRRIIGRKTLEYMTINHLPEGKTLNELGQSLFSEAVMEGMGFGLGFSTLVDPARNGAVSSGGEFAWGGAASTAFWVDPAEEITCVFMTQLMPSRSYPLRRELKATVYQALR
ncbi:MAG: serine hydrolase domain-containing protein [Actinomycetota bacterium]|nr:serine hydrolase domain-containing protein [Actinomycetota bacterium]